MPSLTSLQLSNTCWGCQAHANLPPLGSSRPTPNQGPFPPNWLCCPAGPGGTMGPSDTQRGFRLIAEARAATPRRAGAPVSRRALCRRATPRTPVSDPVVIGRLLPRSPAVFPDSKAGRPSRLHFRGLLRLHTRCGPSACRPTRSGPMSRECFGSLVTLLASSVATGVHRQFPRPDLHRQEARPFYGAVGIRRSPEVYRL